MHRNTTLLLLGVVSLCQQPAVAAARTPYWTLKSAPDSQGVVVSQIDTDTPPYLVGFRRGDVLLSLNRETAGLKSRLETLWNQHRLKQLGKMLTIEVVREGTPLEVQFTNDDCFLTTSSGQKLLLKPLSNSQLRKCATQLPETSGIGWLFEGLKSNQVLPAFSSEGRPIGLRLFALPASRHDFEIGDIIHHVNGQPLMTMEDAFTVQRNSEGARHFQVAFTRQGAEKTIAWSD